MVLTWLLVAICIRLAAGQLNLISESDGTALIWNGLVLFPSTPKKDSAPFFLPTDTEVPFLIWSTSNTTSFYSFTSSFYVWSSTDSNQAVLAPTVTGSSISVDLPQIGQLLPNKTIQFTATSNCTSDFIGVVVWNFLVDSTLFTTSFLWECAEPGCGEKCDYPRGNCSYLEGECECNGNWKGSNCDFNLVFAPEVCPGDELTVSAIVADTTTYQEWIALADQYVTKDWLYVRTLTSTTETPPSNTSDYVTTASGTWTIKTFLWPGTHDFWCYQDDLADDSNGAVIPLTVKTWEECGIVDNSTCESDDDCSYPQGICDTDQGSCVCEQGRFWYDCSRGCSSISYIHNASGTIANDPLAESNMKMRYTVSSTCEWIVTPMNTEENFDAIDVEMQFLDIADGDFVKIYPINASDSTTNESRPIATFVGHSLPSSTITIKAKGIRIVITADYATSACGFRLTYLTRKLPLSPDAIAGIAAPLSAFFLALVIFSFIILRKYRKRKAALLVSKMNEPELDLSTEDEDYTKTIDLSAASNKMKQSGIKIDPILGNDLEFGLESMQPCPVNEQVHQRVTLKNTSNHKIRFFFYAPRDPGRFECKIRPGKGSLHPGTGVIVDILLKLLCTTTIDHRIKISFIVPDEEKPIEGCFLLKLKSALSDRIDASDIILAPRPIAGGAFGSVFKGEYRQHKIAVKVPKKQHEIDQKQMEEFESEVELCRKLRSPFIVEFVGASLVPGKFCMCTEFCEKGSLDQLIKKAFIPIELQLRFAMNIAEAEAYLHVNHVIHRDLKPGNVLIVSTSLRADVNCKITDFGTARNVDDVHQLFMYTLNGTPLYMAPEIFKATAYNGKVDVYAYAITLWQMLSRRIPWDDCPIWDVPGKVMNGERPIIPEFCPREYANMIIQCWDSDASKRPEFTEILKLLEPLKKVAKEADLTIAMEKDEASTAIALVSPRASEKNLNIGADGTRTPSVNISEVSSRMPRSASTSRKEARRKMHRENRRLLENATSTIGSTASNPNFPGSVELETLGSTSRNVNPSSQQSSQLNTELGNALVLSSTSGADSSQPISSPNESAPATVVNEPPQISNQT